MSLASDMQFFSEKLVRECEERRKCMAELKVYVSDYLDQIKNKREQVSREMWDKLNEDRSCRLNSVSEMLEYYIQDRASARESWAEAMEAISKIRLG